MMFACKCGSTHGDTHSIHCDKIERCIECNRTKEDVEQHGHARKCAYRKVK